MYGCCMGPLMCCRVGMELKHRSTVKTELTPIRHNLQAEGLLV